MPTPALEFKGKGKKLVFCMDTDADLRDSNIGLALCNILARLGGEYPVSKVYKHVWHSNKPYPNMPQDGDRRSLSGLKKLVNSVNADAVVTFGVRPALTIQPVLRKVETSWRFGRVFKVDCGDRDVPMVNTLPLSTVVDSHENYTNTAPLLGQVMEAIENALYGKNRYFISKKIKYKMLNTWDDWVDFREMLFDSPYQAWDTEDESLDRVKNTILTYQIATDPSFSWVLPWRHSETPWSGEQLDKMETTLRGYFTGEKKSKAKYHVFANAKFDIIQMRRELKIPFWKYRPYDVQAGEMLFDENRKMLNIVQKKIYTLEVIGHKYGYTGFSDDDGLSKDSRENMAKEKLIDIAKYGGKDSCVTIGIHDCQIAEAKRRGAAYKNYRKTMLEVIGSQILEFVEMERNGFPVDTDYLARSTLDDSEVSQAIKNARAKFYDLKSVKKANRILISSKSSMYATDSIFDTGGDPWIFDDSKYEHLRTLFFEVLGLDPLDYRADGNPSLNNAWKSMHKDNSKAVALYLSLIKARKLKEAFINSFFEKMSEGSGEVSDACMRTVFQFLTILTGRSGSQKPNLQQIPSRGEMSKAIRRLFVAAARSMLIKADYMAHEIRSWGVLGEDEAVVNSFMLGLNRRLDYRLIKPDDLTPEMREKWAKILKNSDVHRANVAHFRGKPIDAVTEQDRDEIKKTIFGVVYGKGGRSLAAEVGVSEREGYALIELLFEKFKGGGSWIKDIQREGERTLMASSPIGRIRHLWGYLHPEQQVKAIMNRRGPNSVNQGLASDLNFIAGRIMQQLVWSMFTKRGFDLKYRSMNKVHDSSEASVQYAALPIALYLLEHAHTTQISKWCENKFDWKHPLPFEIDVALGPHLGDVGKWDWQPDTMLEHAEKSMRWARSNKKEEINITKELKRVEHNLDIVHKMRRAEMREQRKLNRGVSYRMDLNPKTVGEFDFRLDKVAA